MAIEQILSQICRRWRTVALSFPALWTRIVLNCPPNHREKMLMMYMHRSISLHGQALPLELYIDSSDPFSTPKILAIIEANKSRWRAISIRLLSPLAFIELPWRQFNSLDLPQIEHFSITFRTYPTDEEKEMLTEHNLTMLTGSTSIKTLRLQSTGMIFLRIPTVTENVTTLHLRQVSPWPQDYPPLRSFLKSFPSLIHLSLWGDFVPPGSPLKEDTIFTPNLRSLRVSDNKTISTLLLSLSAPQLASLTLRNLSYSSLDLFQHRYKPWACDKFPQLQTLVLIRPQLSNETWKRLFSDFAGITRFDLINCYGDQALELLSERNPELERIGFDVSLPLPYLQTISLHHLKDVKGSFVDFLAARTAQGVAPKLRLHSSIRHSALSVLRANVYRWDALEFWPTISPESSGSEYQVFEDDHDWSMQLLTKPPPERDVLYPPWAPSPEKEKLGWWTKFVNVSKEFLVDITKFSGTRIASFSITSKQY
ncbi:hypothetical protein K435DRAFT_789210 [Dendrothele bispora CBS 962.96]|uniref:Uncharacterized protein n=1 Tax=Dendrothele bispora (strain CBS 962.96) TaxID=1314807 RepID=A0A4S8MU24_DENBC|nr:hypothetical protein K435DRAFT_789210 [Dendrothele bispora CBS 962.96]